MISTIQNIYVDLNIGITVSLLLVLAAMILTGRLRIAFVVLASSMFFKNLSFELVSGLEAWKIAILPLFIGTLAVRDNMYSGIVFVKSTKSIVLLWLFYSIFSSLMFIFISITLYAGSSHYQGFFNNEGRFITQSAYYLMLISLTFIPIAVFSESRQIVSALKWVLHSIILLAMLGVFQKIAYDTTGIDIFPVNRAGVFDYDATLLHAEYSPEIRRINSLAGEPKHLAIVCVIGIGLILNGIKHTLLDFRKYFLGCAVLLFALYYTRSTTGFVLFIILVMHYAISDMSMPGIKRIMIVTVALIPFAAALLIGDGQETVSYLARRTGLEIQDASVMDALIDMPLLSIFGSGAGNIHQLAIQYLPADFPLFRERAFKPNSGILFIIADSGFIGLLLLSTVVFISTRDARRLASADTIPEETKSTLLFLSDILFMSFAFFLVRYSEFFFLIIGLMLSIRTIAAKSIATHRGERRGL